MEHKRPHHLKGKHNSPATEIKKGQRLSPATEFKKGVTSLNKGKRKDLVCGHCGVHFCTIKYSKVKYCSKNCMLLGIRPSRQRHVPSHKGYKASEQARAKMRQIKLNNPRPTSFYRAINLKGLIKQQTSKEPTSIEKKVYQELERRGVLFERQKLINGRFLVDVYIPSLNLIIECDGDYWHSLERVKKKDKAENAYLKKCNYKLLRLSEREIKDDSFMNKLN